MFKAPESPHHVHLHVGHLVYLHVKRKPDFEETLSKKEDILREDLVCYNCFNQLTFCPTTIYEAIWNHLC